LLLSEGNAAWGQDPVYRESPVLTNEGKLDGTRMGSADLLDHLFEGRFVAKVIKGRAEDVAPIVSL
jgi:hypothetical protein